MQWCYGGKVSIIVCIVRADWWKGYLWRPQLEMWFVKFCHMICNMCFISMAGDSNHDTYYFQNVKTRVGRKPLSYFVLVTPYSFWSLNFCVTACQVKKNEGKDIDTKNLLYLTLLLYDNLWFKIDVWGGGLDLSGSGWWSVVECWEH